MKTWSEKIEEELTILLKDWLKQHGRTQADLRKSLGAISTRMPSLLEVLENEYNKGGMPRLAARLCSIEKEWTTSKVESKLELKSQDPFGQLDLLLQAIRDDCPEENKHSSY